MGESKRRKQLDPNYGQSVGEEREILEFFGEEWFRRHSRAERRQAYQGMKLFTQTLTPDELQEVKRLWESDSPRRPFVHVLMDYILDCGRNPLVTLKSDACGRLSGGILLE